MRLVFIIPVVIFFALAGIFLAGLFGGDPGEIPSPLIGQPAPGLALEPITGYRENDGGLADVDLRLGTPALVNFWASWCAPCRVEHPLLMELSRTLKIPVYGINYKDKPEAAREFLSSLGDPFTRHGADTDGRVAIDWGVYGVPETYLVDGNGTIILKHVGPLTEDVVRSKIEPALAKAQAQAQK